MTSTPSCRYLDDPLDTTVLVVVAGGGTIPAALTKKLKEVEAGERAPESEKTDEVLIARPSKAKCSWPTPCTDSTALGEDAGRVASFVDVLAAAYRRHDARRPTTSPYLGEAGAWRRSS